MRNLSYLTVVSIISSLDAVRFSVYDVSITSILESFNFHIVAQKIPNPTVVSWAGLSFPND